ncbi:MAG: hypothetical protein ACRDPO_38670 [Streptosporangiaceae bacterium]
MTGTSFETATNKFTAQGTLDRMMRAPAIGYDQAAVISHHAITHDLAHKQAALANGVSEELYDQVVDPLALTRPGPAEVPAASPRSWVSR